MNIVNKKIGEIKPYEKNPRKNDGAVKYVANSIKEFGFKVPIVIDKDGVIIAGHTRYKASKELGLKEVPCIVADDLNDEQIKAYRLADNKVNEAAEWDFNLLDSELAEIMNLDMELFNFDIDLLNADDFDTDFELANGGKGNIQQMTFTLTNEQAELIKYAIEQTKEDVFETFGNTNSNGNALYEVVRQWAELKK